MDDIAWDRMGCVTWRGDEYTLYCMWFRSKEWNGMEWIGSGLV